MANPQLKGRELTRKHVVGVLYVMHECHTIGRALSSNSLAAGEVRSRKIWITIRWHSGISGAARYRLKCAPASSTPPARCRPPTSRCGRLQQCKLCSSAAGVGRTCAAGRVARLRHNLTLLLSGKGRCQIFKKALTRGQALRIAVRRHTDMFCVASMFSVEILMKKKHKT